MNDNIKSWEEILNSYKEVRLMPTRPTGKKLSPDHIINSSKSVDWNRDKVKQYNEVYSAKSKELRIIKAEAERTLHKHIEDKIAYELSITNSRAKILWDYIYNQYYKENPEVIIDAIETLVDTLYNAFRC